MPPLLENKKAYFNYEIIDRFEAGVKLIGSEVKSIKSGRGNITGSYIKIFGDEAYILGMEVQEFQKSNLLLSNVDKTRTRKLLLNSSEIKKLKKYTEEKGMSIVPLSVYIKRRFVKIYIGVGKGKKTADKRETIKKRDVERSLRREHSVR